MSRSCGSWVLGLYANEGFVGEFGLHVRIPLRRPSEDNRIQRMVVR